MEAVSPSPSALPPEPQPRVDAITSSTSIYQVSPGEIIWRNFLAGASRALGTLVIYVVFLLIGYWFLSRTILPIFLPLMQQSLKALETLESSQQMLMELQGGSPALIQQYDLDPSTMQQIQDLYLGPPSGGQNSAGSSGDAVYQATPVR